MNRETWQALRWLVALAVCALVVVVSVPLAIDALTSGIVIGGDPGEEQEGRERAVTPAEPAGQVPSGPVDDGSATPELDFAVVDGVVGQSTARTLDLAGGAAVLVFPLVDGDPACVGTAQLELQLLDADPTEVGVYAAAVTAGADGEEVGDPRRDDTVHALALTDGSPGRLRWDVTELYRAWAGGTLASPGAPFAVAVTPPGDPAALRFAAAEAGPGDAPELVWEGVPDCGASA
ncbi:MAG TPA: hypothetical protein VM324_08675 [Egibacteraceae bacterium]|nr:hypothetical protein [Egibacteraceae bacterium]